MNELEHHGVKGQKWGVRRAAKKSAKADAKWQKNIYSNKGFIALHNAVADKMNNGLIDKLNSDPRFTNDKLGNQKVFDQYLKEHGRMAEKAADEAVTQVHGISPSGKYKATIDHSNNEYWAVKLVPTNVSHDTLLSAPVLTMELNHDERNHITYVRKIPTEMAQSVEIGNNFLEHHGVKGQRWGVRRKSVSRKEASVRSSRQKVSDRRRQLSDSDLKKFIERLDNEKKLKTLVDADLRPGSTVAKKILSDSGQKVARTVLAGAALYAVKVAVEKKFDPKEASKFIAPIPKK